MTLENITTSGNIFQYHMVFEKAIFIFHVTFFNVTWKMKLVLQYYTFRKKISNNIFFGPILMELHFLFMNGKLFMHKCHGDMHYYYYAVHLQKPR